MRTLRNVLISRNSLVGGVLNSIPSIFSSPDEHTIDLDYLCQYLEMDTISIPVLSKHWVCK